MSVTNLQAIPLITKIKEGIQNGHIEDLKALQTALEDVLSSLDRQEASEPTNVPDDNLFDILLEMKSINEKVESCNAHLAKLQQAKSKPNAIANSTAVAREANGTVIVRQDASVQAATSEGMSTAFVPLPASVPPARLPPDPANPHIRRARVYFPSTPRAIMICPPGHPGYQTLIRDSDGNVIIALDELEEQNPLRREEAVNDRQPDPSRPDVHEQRNPLRREGAFYGEEHLQEVLYGRRGAFDGEEHLRALYGLRPSSPRSDVRHPLRPEGAFDGERHLDEVHGRRSSSHRPSPSQSAPADDETARVSQDSVTGTTVERNVAGASESAPTSPVMRANRVGSTIVSRMRPKKRTEDDGEIKKKEEEDKPVVLPTIVTQARPRDRAEAPRHSIPLPRRRTRRVVNVGRDSEEELVTPTPASRRVVLGTGPASKRRRVAYSTKCDPR
ncbi:hypothetical protein JVU11DRAFT_3057 [Chiua virens]|nr:hypothetical protein JVU11DRAFT_3057 [Chiua virens]